MTKEKKLKERKRFGIANPMSSLYVYIFMHCLLVVFQRHEAEHHHHKREGHIDGNSCLAT